MDKIKLVFKNESPVAITIEEFVERKLDGSDYDRGQLEEIQATGHNTVKAFARLLDALYRRGDLDQKQLYEIVTGYKSG